MFDGIKEDITRKFIELKLWVSKIPTRTSDSDFATISRGLFFVYIYGIYEEIIRRTVVATIEELNSSAATIDRCTYELYAILFSSEYDSLYCVGNEKKWEKRWEISNRFIQNQTIQIQSDLFPTDGRNLRIRQLQSIANSFGMKENVLPRNEVRGYIEEMVNNRNDIAHGNKLPKEIGRNYTVNDLIKICNLVSETCTHIVTIYERYIQDRKYLK